MSERIPKLVNAVKTRPTSPTVLTQECITLYQMCKDNLDNQQCAQKAGGLEAFANAMENEVHRDDGLSQTAFCNCLLAICSSREPSVAIPVIAQVTSTIVQSLKQHQDEELHMAGLQVIGCMASMDSGWTEADRHEVMKQDDLVEVIMASMRTHQKHGVIQASGCRLFSLLVMYEDTLVQQFRARNACGMILGAMDFYLKDDSSETSLLARSPAVHFRDCCLAIARFFGHPPRQGQSVRVSDAGLDRYVTYEEPRIGTLCTFIHAGRIKCEVEVQLTAVLAMYASTA
jgi:hypothetical protein